MPDIDPDKIKQVIIINRGLKMRRGKEIAQGAHASIAFLTKKIQKYKEYQALSDDSYEYFVDYLTEVEEFWIKGNFAKITLQAHSEQELLDLHKKAQDAGLESNLILDEGLTEFAGVHRYTALAIGPDHSSSIDPITGSLELY